VFGFINASGTLSANTDRLTGRRLKHPANPKYHNANGKCDTNVNKLPKKGAGVPSLRVVRTHTLLSYGTVQDVTNKVSYNYKLHKLQIYNQSPLPLAWLPTEFMTSYDTFEHAQLSSTTDGGCPLCLCVGGTT
jgi:hypothetical protein